MNKLIDLIKWVFRTRSKWSVLLKAGMYLMALSIGGGILLELSFAMSDINRSIDVGLIGTRTPTWIATATFILGFLVCVLSLFICFSDWRHSRRLQARKVCLVIEIRGLRQMLASPLIDHVQNESLVACQPLIIDLREALYDGEIAYPYHALEKVKNIHERILESSQQRDPSDVSIVLGGLAPVPFTFLTGLLIDDERHIEIKDWNRHKRIWSSLKAPDDGERFLISDFQNINSSNVALCISASYTIDPTIVQTHLPTTPIVSMKLTSNSPDNHWSTAKQQALGQQFTDTILQMQSSGVKHIDLFLSAQMSFVFHLGGLYDKRNMPSVQVHQYEPRDQPLPPHYPWALVMPVSGKRVPMILESNQ